MIERSHRAIPKKGGSSDHCTSTTDNDSSLSLHSEEYSKQRDGLGSGSSRNHNRNSSSRRLLFNDSSTYSTATESVGSDSIRRQSVSSSINDEIKASFLEPAEDQRKSRIMDEMTINKLPFKSLGLVGRKAEKERLAQCLARSCLQQTRELILIAGVSGTGKTTLAYTLETNTLQQDGLFVYGKYDLSLRDQPYSGISTACRELCGSILLLRDKGRNTKSPSFSMVATQITDKMGPELPLLVMIIPELEEVVGSLAIMQRQRQNRTANLEENKNRIIHAVCRFFRIICSLFPSLVICLDDLQWSDMASLDLLESLLTDEDICNLVVAICYRSDEVRETHQLNHMTRELNAKKSESLHITEISIGNLEVANICELLAELLSVQENREDLVELAEICQRKTLGNPFFLLAFISHLNQLELLQYNLGLLQWVWDNSNINEKAGSTQNVKDILVGKMESLPHNVSKLLAILACMGSSFQTSVVKAVWGKYCHKHNMGETTGSNFQAPVLESLLVAAVEQGFLERHGCECHQFVHDQLQAVALSVIEKKKLAGLKSTVGHILLSELTTRDDKELLFVAVNLLNEGLLPTDDNGKTKLAQLNLQAAERAVECSAFASASKYVLKGTELLPPGKWTHAYDLALSLHSLGTEVEAILGNDGDMMAHCQEVLDQESPIQDKFRVYNVLQVSFLNSNKRTEAVVLGLDVLKKLRCKFPKTSLAIALTTLCSLVKTEMGLKNVSPKQMNVLPVLTDPNQLEIAHLLDQLATACYLSKHHLLPLVLMRNYRHTLKHGISTVSPPAFAGMGLLLCAAIEDFAGAMRLAKCATTILERLKCQSTRSRTNFILNAFVLPWQKPCQSLMKPLLNAYHDGLSSGDNESAMWCVHNYIFIGYQCGKNVALVEADCVMYCEQMRALKLLEIWDATMVIKEALMELRGTVDPVLSLDYQAFCDRWDNLGLVGQSYAQLEQIRLSTIFGDYALAADLAHEMGDSFKDTLPAHHPNMSYAFYTAVASFALAREGKGQKYGKQAKKYHAIIKAWVKKGNPNSLHALHLLDAEKAALGGQKKKAEELYHKAVATSARAGFTQDAGLASERFAHFLWKDCKDPGDAKRRLEESIRFYSEWGALRKVGMLEEEYSKLSVQHHIHICNADLLNWSE